MSALNRREKKHSVIRMTVDKKMSIRKVEIRIAIELADGRMCEMNKKRCGKKGIRGSWASPA